jgi:hypothetical protein
MNAHADTKVHAEEMAVEQWLAIRKEAGLRIDPETAEVYWEYGHTLDPYGVDPDLPAEYRQIGRLNFARAPDSDIWVCFYDLPDTTREALWEKHKGTLAYPAGLSLKLLEAELLEAFTKYNSV